MASKLLQAFSTPKGLASFYATGIGSAVLAYQHPSCDWTRSEACQNFVKSTLCPPLGWVLGMEVFVDTASNGLCKLWDALSPRSTAP
jgi:hypothetical protein